MFVFVFACVCAFVYVNACSSIHFCVCHMLLVHIFFIVRLSMKLSQIEPCNFIWWKLVQTCITAYARPGTSTQAHCVISNLRTSNEFVERCLVDGCNMLLHKAVLFFLFLCCIVFLLLALPFWFAYACWCRRTFPHTSRFPSQGLFIFVCKMTTGGKYLPGLDLNTVFVFKRVLCSF